MRQKVTAGTLRRFASSLPLALLAAGATSVTGGCSGGESSRALPDDVQAILFLQRMPRGDQGNVFDYTSYSPGARLVKLEPPSADGQLTVLFPTADHCVAMGMEATCVDQVDIMSYDLNFNADSIVFSARTPDSGQFQLFTMNVNGSVDSLRQLTGDGNDYVYPIYLPGGKILYTTNLVDSVADEGAAQFTDEYERQTTAQVGTINIDGSNQVLGPRNVSHRVAPALLPDGQVLYTEWRHMGGINDGHLRVMNTDMTGMREAFGGEVRANMGNTTTNSYLKARHVATTQIPDPDNAGRTIANHQVVAIATSRDRTLQSGKLLLINLNGSETHSASRDLTPLVPGGEDPSGAGVGRYYDAEPVGASAPNSLLVSWADGPVESETLALAGTTAQFGIYVYDMNSKKRFPVYDALNYWDVLARPLRPRLEPQVASSPVPLAGQDTTIGALNVYDSSLGEISRNLTPGSVEKVRLIEGFSGEEGGVDMFGTSEFDGQSLYGEIDIKADNSFAAVVPGNVPFKIQLVDKFGLSIANESIWISGRAGEQRFCGGCHENRTKTAALAPGIQQAVLAGAVNLVTPRPLRKSTTAFAMAGGSLSNPGTQLRGIPWDTAIQPILDAKCASCHNGQPGPANPSYTVMDNATGMSQEFVFDLRGQKVAVTVGERMTGDFTASYLSLMGLGELLSDAEVTITGSPKQYVEPGSALDSLVIRMLNPMQRFPSVDANVRAFTDRTFDGMTLSGGAITHAAGVGAPELTADEYRLLILNIDMGGQFFFRENLDTAGGYTP